MFNNPKTLAEAPRLVQFQYVIDESQQSGSRCGPLRAAHPIPSRYLAPSCRPPPRRRRISPPLFPVSPWPTTVAEAQVHLLKTSAGAAALFRYTKIQGPHRVGFRGERHDLSSSKCASNESGLLSYAANVFHRPLNEFALLAFSPDAGYFENKTSRMV